MSISDELKNEIEVAVDDAAPEVDENDKQNLDENEETNNDSQGVPVSEEGDRDDSLVDLPSSSVPIVAVAEEPDQLVPPLARTPSSAAIWPWIRS